MLTKSTISLQPGETFNFEQLQISWTLGLNEYYEVSEMLIKTLGCKPRITIYADNIWIILWTSLRLMFSEKRNEGEQAAEGSLASANSVQRFSCFFLRNQFWCLIYQKFLIIIS